MFAGISKQDIEIYAGVNNILRINLENNEGERIKLTGGTFEAGVKLNIGAKDAIARFDVTSDERLELRMSATESSKLLKYMGRQDKDGYYDVILLTDDGDRFAVVYGDVSIKRGVMVHE